MSGSNRDVISALNDLIETCRDGEEGFRHAGRRVRDRKIRSLFGDYARQSAEFATELEEEVRRLGGDPGEHSVFDGLAQPGWITIARKLTGEDETAILAECDCGVDALERSYAGALERELPGAVRSLVERQHRQVREVSDRVHALAGRHPFGVRPSSPGQKRGTDRARTKNRPAAGPGKRARGELREPDALGPATPQG
jgi:uncharacterized protein (TIGR02284 family)